MVPTSGPFSQDTAAFSAVLFTVLFQVHVGSQQTSQSPASTYSTVCVYVIKQMACNWNYLLPPVKALSTNHHQ